MIALAMIGYGKDVLPQSVTIKLLHSTPVNSLVDLTAFYVNTYLVGYHRLGVDVIGVLGMMAPVLRVTRALSNMISVESRRGP